MLTEGELRATWCEEAKRLVDGGKFAEAAEYLKNAVGLLDARAMSSERDDGGPAFPVTPQNFGFAPGDDRPGLPASEGMSLRAWLAGTIAAGHRAANVNFRSDVVATLAVEDADAIIAELKK